MKKFMLGMAALVALQTGWAADTPSVFKKARPVWFADTSALTKAKTAELAGAEAVFRGYTCNYCKNCTAIRDKLYEVVGMRWRYWNDNVNIQDLQMTTSSGGTFGAGITSHR